MLGAPLTGATTGSESTLHLSVAEGDAAPAIDLHAAPFLPVAATLALLAGEDLTVDAPVTAAQRDGVQTAAGVLARWMDRRPPSVRTASDAVPPGSPAPGQGLLFTRGVDSWATLLAHRHLVTHLVFVDGVEPLHPPEARARVRAATAEAADAAGLPLLCVASDARAHLDPLALWDHTHGAALVSAALLVSPVLGGLLVASSHAAGAARPWGTHPELDRHWSTPALAVQHDPAPKGRWDKTVLVAGHPPALATLHVCWEGGSERNCGRCRKCLLTMSALDALGVLDRCPRFDAPLRLEAIAALPPRPPGRNHNALDLLAHLPRRSPLARAWAATLPDEELASPRRRGRPGRARLPHRRRHPTRARPGRRGS